jgi:hypothetical protein
VRHDDDVEIRRLPLVVPNAEESPDQREIADAGNAREIADLILLKEAPITNGSPSFTVADVVA